MKKKKIRRKPEEYTKIRKKALAHVNSVNYGVSLRWLFYRMLQDGDFIKTKKDYYPFKDLIARARKENIDGWKQDFLKDDTRKISLNCYGSKDKKDWFEEMKKEECVLDVHYTQDYFIMILFEAKAMISQFEYYTKNISLSAFGGDASIPLKYDIAKTIEWASQEYKKPIIVLYFGDCDDKGSQIYQSALKDIKDWCSVDFEFKFCGLTKQQAKTFKLPTNPKKPDEYQWEALTDPQAKHLIEKNVNPFLNKMSLEKLEKKQKRITKSYQKIWENQ